MSTVVMRPKVLRTAVLFPHFWIHVILRLAFCVVFLMGLWCVLGQLMGHCIPSAKHRIWYKVVV